VVGTIERHPEAPHRRRGAPWLRFLSHPERLIIVHPDCGRDVPEGIRAAAYALFDAALNGG
jgi:hypothetical protein